MSGLQNADNCLDIVFRLTCRLCEPYVRTEERTANGGKNHLSNQNLFDPEI